MMNRLLIFISFMSVSLMGYSQTDDVLQKGQHVPDFVVENESGQSFHISDYKGSVVFINFFATWCGPCRMEMPLLQEKVWLKYKDHKNFKFLSIGRGHTLSEVKEFKEKSNFGFPVCPDKDKAVYTNFATKYIPRNYIIDPKGEIVYASVGFSQDEFAKMLELLESLLKNQ